MTVTLFFLLARYSARTEYLHEKTFQVGWLLLSHSFLQPIQQAQKICGETLFLLKIMSRNICFKSRTPSRILFSKHYSAGTISRTLFDTYSISRSIRRALFLALYSARTMNLHIKFYQVTIPLFSQSGILFDTERKHCTILAETI